MGKEYAEKIGCFGDCVSSCGAGFFCSGCSVARCASSHTIVVPNDYPTINQAIENAVDGDTIILKNGVYNEQTVEVNKSLTITGENALGAQLSLHPPQISEDLWGQTIWVFTSPLKVDADNVKISGLTITSDGGDIEANGNQIQLLNNVIGNQNTSVGLILNGNRTQVTNNSMGKLSLTGSNQTIIGNHAEGTAQIMGDFNLLIKNYASAIGVLGSYNSVTQNTVVTSESGDVCIELASGDHNVFSGNTVGYSMGAGLSIGYGLVIDYHGIGGGSYNIFAGNTVSGAHLWGALLGNGSYNVFYGNLVEDCGGLGHDGYGLAMGGTEYIVENNLVFYNSFVNNSKNFGGNWQVMGSNVFDNGSVGNYWDDYLTVYPNATAVGNSGTGNMPYLVYGDSMDNHPLLNKPEVSTVILSLPAPWSTLLSSTLTVYASLSASQNPTTPNTTVQPTEPSNPEVGNQSEPQHDVPETSIYAIVAGVVAVSAVAVVSLIWRKRVEVSLKSPL